MKNVILITKEVLRKDFIGCYQKENLGQTPNIDRLASNGTVFHNHYTAAPSTAMSITCMFSGMNIFELDRKSYTEVEQFNQTETLFSLFENRGYDTHVIWPKNYRTMAWTYSKVFSEKTIWHELSGNEFGPDFERCSKCILNPRNSIKRPNK